MPKAPWDGVLDGARHPALCPQFADSNRGVFIGDEDCLQLRVHVLVPYHYWILMKDQVC